MCRSRHDTCFLGLDAMAREIGETSIDSELAMEQYIIYDYLCHGIVLLGSS